MVKVDKTTSQHQNTYRIFFFWLILIISSIGVWAQTALGSIQNAAEWTMSSNGSTIATVEDIEIETPDFYFGNQSYPELFTNFLLQVQITSASNTYEHLCARLNLLGLRAKITLSA